MKKPVCFDGQTTLLSFATMAEDKAEAVIAKETEAAAEVKGEKKKAKKPKTSPLLKFYKEHNGIVIDDMSNEASVNSKNSKDFMSFCRKLKIALKKEAKEKGFDDVTLMPNHYDMSGFFKKGEHYVYWHFSVQRYGTPTSLDGTDYRNGILYRTASHPKDFKGGQNHYTCLLNLVDDALELIEKEKTVEDKSFGFEKAINVQKLNTLTGDELKKVADILEVDNGTKAAA